MRLVDAAILPYPTRSDRPLIYAHRGASAYAPENTLDAFVLARAHGADGVELDAMVCGSGEVVVCHDAWLDRLANRRLCVAATPLSTLREVNVAAHFRSWRGAAQIPTLDAVLDAVPNLLVNIELKVDRADDLGLAKKVAAIVRAHHAQARVVISSFNPLELLRMRAFAPRLPLAFLYDRSGPLWARLALPAPLTLAQAVHPEHTLINRRSVSRWHGAGFRVAAWTVDDPVRALSLRDVGVDALVTDAPARLLRALAPTA